MGRLAGKGICECRWLPGGAAATAIAAAAEARLKQIKQSVKRPLKQVADPPAISKRNLCSYLFFASQERLVLNLVHVLVLVLLGRLGTSHKPAQLETRVPTDDKYLADLAAERRRRRAFAWPTKSKVR